MSKEKKHCTILDQVSDKVRDILSKNCMTSTLARTDPKGKRTFLQPKGDALKKLEKMSKEKGIQAIKSLIIKGNINSKVLEKKDGEFEGRTISGHTYKLEKDGKGMIVDGISAKLVDESPRNGTIYEVSELPDVKAAKSSAPTRSKGKKRSKSKRKHRAHDDSDSDNDSDEESLFNILGGGYSDSESDDSMAGGEVTDSDSDSDNMAGGEGTDSDESEYTFEEELTDDEIDFYGGSDSDMEGGSQEVDLLELYGGQTAGADIQALQNAFFDMRNEYQEQFGDSMHTDLNWANRMFSHFLLFGNDAIPNFRKTYMPFITSDPLASMSILFQLYEDPLSLSKNLIDMETVLGFKNSRYFLSEDSDLVKQGAEFLLGFASPQYMQEYPIETVYFMSPQWENESSYIRGMFGNTGNILDLMNTRDSSGKASNEIVGLYKKMYGEPNRYAPGTVTVFKQSYKSTMPEQELKNDFMRYVIKLIYNKPTYEFDNIMTSIFARDSSSFMDLFSNLSDGVLMDFTNQGPWAFNANLMLELNETSIPGLSLLNTSMASLSATSAGLGMGSSSLGMKKLTPNAVNALF